jgi:hypothetical protein
LRADSDLLGPFATMNLLVSLSDGVDLAAVHRVCEAIARASSLRSGAEEIDAEVSRRAGLERCIESRRCVDQGEHS